MDGWMLGRIFFVKGLFVVYSKGMEGKTCIGGKNTGSDLEIEICNGASLMEFLLCNSFLNSGGKFLCSFFE